MKVSTCKYWWHRYRIKGDFKTNPRSGRKRKTNARQDEDILKTIQENPFHTAVQIARDFGVSRTTISNRFHDGGIKRYASARQTELSESQRKDRIAYFKLLADSNDQKRLNRIIFSDEKTFKSDIVRQTNVYRPRNSRFKAKYSAKVRLSGRISSSYWGAIGVEGPITDLVRIDGHFNSEKYLMVLRKQLIPSMKRFKNDRIFMQDNSPVHTAKVVLEFLSKQKFESLKWCPYSPDANPIENVWALMTKDWPKIKNRTPEALDKIVQERWSNLKKQPEYFRHLYESLPRRCAQILENDGHFCKY